MKSAVPRLLDRGGREMACRVLMEGQAVDRLAELGLTVEMVERVLRRAEAEASTCTPLDPPIMEGLTRWGRRTRFFREELIGAGWTFDNPRNLARTIHPSGEFAIVITSGDELTGVISEIGQTDLRPSTKYRKGYATVSAVQRNQQLTLDYGDFDVSSDVPTADAGDLLTWFLVVHTDVDSLHVELSLPDAILDGRITSWVERIVLPAFPREDDTIAGLTAPDEGDPNGDIVVEVNRR
jgi:hypothetical protein